ncbi:transposable element Tcb2 transposase [Trichonephila clavipes]|nr:transposable element Tcb2 transposase [Trichonephila clavipes]
MCRRRHGGGRVRSTTPAEDRYIVLSAKRNTRTTAQQVANQFLAASGKQISRKTVARRLKGGGLYARRPVVCVPLTRQHRTARLQWCREHHNRTEQDWACVLFSDESRFSLSSDCRRQLIWRESGTAYRPENIQEKDRYPTCSIMVWAGIMINGRTRLYVVANGTMTGQRYIDEVLLPHVRLFRGAVGDKFVFMDDNATCHRTLAVQDCLDSEGIQRLVWPARSADLNPIENVWDALGRQVAGRNYPPTNKNTLIRALTEEWDKLPQQLLDNVAQSDFSLKDEPRWGRPSDVNDEVLRNISGIGHRIRDLRSGVQCCTTKLPTAHIWLNGNVPHFHITVPRFKPRGEEGRLSLSYLQWVYERLPSLLGNLILEVLHQADHLTGTSSHAPQGPRCDCDRGVHRGAVRGEQRTSVRYLRFKGSSLFPDPSNGSNGSKRWNMETFGISGLRTQTDEPRTGRPSDINDEVLHKMIRTNPTLTFTEMGFKRGIYQTITLDYNRSLHFVSKLSICVLHELRSNIFLVKEEKSISFVFVNIRIIDTSSLISGLTAKFVITVAWKSQTRGWGVMSASPGATKAQQCRGADAC